MARTEGKSEPPVPWETGRVNGRRIHFQLHVFAGSTSAWQPPVHCMSKWDLATDYEGQWQKVGTSKAVAVASKVHQETFRLIRAFALCKFAGWPVYETLGLEKSSSSGFFPGHQAGLGAVDPIVDGLEHRGHRKFQLYYPWRSDPRPWRQRRYRLSSKWRLNHGGLRDYFYSKKNSKSPQRKRKEKERKRENEWKKKEWKKQQQLKPHDSSLRERSKSTSAWPPRPKSSRQGRVATVAEASGACSQVVQHSSVFVQRYYRRKI